MPVEGQARALEEAARVLEPRGLLYVQEPLAAGAYFELMRPVEDETHVRAKALEALKAAAAGPVLREERELAYEAPYIVAGFEAFKAQVIAVDESRRPRFEAREAALETAFETAGERRDGAVWFLIPSRLNLLRKVG